MKSLLFVILAFLPVSICAASDADLQHGISLYKSHRNEEAKTVLSKVADRSQNPEAHYYLANVLMNMNEFDGAVLHYYAAAEGKYNRTDCMFNCNRLDLI